MNDCRLHVANVHTKRVAGAFLFWVEGLSGLLKLGNLILIDKMQVIQRYFHCPQVSTNLSHFSRGAGGITCCSSPHRRVGSGTDRGKGALDRVEEDQNSKRNGKAKRFPVFVTTRLAKVLPLPSDGSPVPSDGRGFRGEVGIRARRGLG